MTGAVNATTVSAMSATAVTLSWLVARGQLVTTALIAGWCSVLPTARWSASARPALLPGFQMVRPAMVALSAVWAVRAASTSSAAFTTSSSLSSDVDVPTHPGQRTAGLGEIRIHSFADHPDADLARWPQ